MAMSDKIFKSCLLKKVSLIDRNKKLYRIYRKEDDFVEIEAQTVHEAIDKGQIEHPYAIKILINRLSGIIEDHNKLASVQDNDLIVNEKEPLDKKNNEQNPNESTKRTTE